MFHTIEEQFLVTPRLWDEWIWIHEDWRPKPRNGEKLNQKKKIQLKGYLYKLPHGVDWKGGRTTEHLLFSLFLLPFFMRFLVYLWYNFPLNSVFIQFTFALLKLFYHLHLPARYRGWGAELRPKGEWGWDYGPQTLPKFPVDPHKFRLFLSNFLFNP